MYQKPEIFFTQYYGQNQNVEYFATRKNENVVVKVKDTNHVVATFKKKDLVKYYLDQGKCYRFNTCPSCKEVTVFEIEGFFEFGEKPELLPSGPLTETENRCGETRAFEKYNDEHSFSFDIEYDNLDEVTDFFNRMRSQFS